MGVMPASILSPTDFLVMDAATYKGAIDADFNAFLRTAGNFAPRLQLPQLTRNMSALVEPGHLMTGAGLVEQGVRTTGNVTSGSTSVGSLALSTGIAVGQVCVGYTFNALSLTANTSSGSTSVSVSSTTGLYYGMGLYGPGLAPNTTISNAASNPITISQPATANGTGVTLSALGLQPVVPLGAVVTSVNASAGSVVLSQAAIAAVNGAVFVFCQPIGTTTPGNLTSGSNSVGSLVSTAGIFVGLTAAGAGIPGGATVSGVTATTVTLSANATATASAVEITFGIPATSVNSRIDRVVVDRITGVASWVEGTQSASPVPPAIPTGKSPLYQIGPIGTGTTAIAENLVTDERDLSALGRGSAALNVVSTSQSVGAGQQQQGWLNTAAVTLTIAQTTTLNTEWQAFGFAYGGNATITPNAADAINGGSAGASVVVPKGYSWTLTTDANGNLYLEQSQAFLGNTSIASASSCDIGSVASPVVQITGTTTINDFGQTMQAGEMRLIYFGGALSLSNNSNIILEGNENITTSAGDMALAFCSTSGSSGVPAIVRVIYAALAGASELTGMLKPYGGACGRLGSSVPAGYLLCAGQAVSRSTYAALFSVLCPSAVCTISIASPGVITLNGHGLQAGDPVAFETTGTLPTGITADTTYYVVNPTTNTFEISATVGGVAINTSGSQSGTQTCFFNPFGTLTSTTFSVPDLRGRSIFGVDNMGGTAANRVTSAVSGIVGTTPGAAGGDQNLQAHSHTVGSIPNPGGATNNLTGGAAGSYYTFTTSTAGAGASQNMPPGMMANWLIHI